MKRVIAALIATAAVLVPATASAKPYKYELLASKHETRKAQRIAEHYWHVRPCRGKVKVIRADYERAARAAAYWRNPHGNLSFKHVRSNFDCEVYFDTTGGWKWTWPIFCSVMIHEYGHLLGHHHSRDRANVMHSNAIPYIPMCGPTP